MTRITNIKLRFWFSHLPHFEWGGPMYWRYLSVIKYSDDLP